MVALFARNTAAAILVAGIRHIPVVRIKGWKHRWRLSRLHRVKGVKDSTAPRHRPFLLHMLHMLYMLYMLYMLHMLSTLHMLCMLHMEHG